MDVAQASVERILEANGRLIRALNFGSPAPGMLWDDMPLTAVQMRLLGVLSSSPDGVSGRELATTLHVWPSAITPVVDRLVEQGYARREVDPADRRVIRVRATDEGLAVLEGILAGRRERMAALLARLSPTELEVVERAFQVLVRTVEIPPAEPIPPRANGSLTPGPAA